MADTPAWMVCEDIISRASAELMSEALALLRSEIKAGRIKVDGKMVTSSELTSEDERDIFVLEKLLDDEQNMRQRYENFANAVESGNETDPEVVGRLQEVKKFLLAVSQISMTVGHARTFSNWFNAAASLMKIKEPEEIIYLTAKGNAQRISALEFITSSKEFARSGVFSGTELAMLKRVNARCTLA